MNIDAYANYVYNGGEKLGKFDEKNNRKLIEDWKGVEKFYINWRNSNGKDCKAIGVATKCFCDHRLKDHKPVNPTSRAIACAEKKCLCKHFYYVPIHGSLDFKCLCKHSYRDHTSNSRDCVKCPCNLFKSTWSCSCNMKFPEHKLVVETREEWLAEGRFVSEIEGMINEGRLESFTDLVDP